MNTKNNLSDLEKEVLAVLLDWNAVGDENAVSRDKVLEEVYRRLVNKESGMAT